MSPPIYTPDGSEVSEIVLPDGSTASQVIDPDGNVVFEAGPDIPDSVVMRIPLSEGSGSTAQDTIGTNNGSIVNENWVSGTWIDGFALDDDIVELSTINEVADTKAWSVAFTVETDGDVSGDERCMTYDDGTLSWGVEIGNGNITVRFIADNTVIGGSVSANTKYRVFIVYDGTPQAVYFNGTEVTDSPSVNGVSPDSQGWFWGGQGGSGSYNPTPAVQDELIAMGQAETQSTAQEDYDRQPWS